jgi:hypothetical protein
MTAAERKHPGRLARTKVSDQCCCQNDEGKRCIERKDRHEGSRGDPPHPSVAQRPGANAVGRVQDQRCHGRLDAIENACDHRDISEAQVDP